MKNKKVAMIVMVSLIVFSTLIQARSGLLKLTHSAETMFRVTEDKYNNCIYNDLTRKRTTALEMGNKVALHYLSAQDPVILEVQAAVEELSKSVTISQLSVANRQLDQAVLVLKSKLEVSDMSDVDEKEVFGLYGRYLNYNSTIEKSGYNSYASKVNETLNQFPANLFKQIFNIQEVELFH